MITKHVSPILTKNFGNKHRALRKARGRTQEEASKAYRVSQSSVSKMEAGVSGPNGVATVSVDRMAKFLGVTPDQLFA